MISLFVLVLFSFFYTDKVMNLINKNDPLMNKIDLLKDKYEILPVNAILEDNTIIPGVKGKIVDLDKSYDNMKVSGIFREDYLIYNELLPSELLSNNMDKYIIKGNSSNNKISLLVLGDSNNIDKINKDNITIFLNHKDISINNIKKLSKNSFSKISKTPKNTPQSTKFQLAPCHNPVSSQTIAILRICFAKPLRLPPSGM